VRVGRRDVEAISRFQVLGAGRSTDLLPAARDRALTGGDPSIAAVSQRPSGWIRVQMAVILSVDGANNSSIATSRGNIPCSQA
jgi:hypothetical protein